MNESVYELEVDIDEELLCNIPDIVTYIKDFDQKNISENILKDIEDKKNIMNNCGKSLINQCERLGFTSVRCQYGDSGALSYMLDIKLKSVLPYREKYINALKDYLRVASKIHNVEGWLNLIELIMIETPEKVTTDIFNNWLEVSRRVED